MKTITLAVTCDVAGCLRVGVKDAAAKGAAVASLIDAGWRMGATRDVCPDCREKGHRP